MIGSLSTVLHGSLARRCLAIGSRVVPVLVLGLMLVLMPVDAAASPKPPPPVVVMIVDGGGTCMSAFCFQSAALTVRSGTTVVWMNQSSADHTVTRCTKAACGVSGGTGRDKHLSSPVIASGSSYRFTFHGRGTYVYYCTIHGFATMHGGVTVSRRVVVV